MEAARDSQRAAIERAHLNIMTELDQLEAAYQRVDKVGPAEFPLTPSEEARADPELGAFIDEIERPLDAENLSRLMSRGDSASRAAWRSRRANDRRRG